MHPLTDRTIQRHLAYTIFVVCLYSIVVSTILAPSNFPTQTIIVVEDGLGLQELAEHLHDEGVVQSPFWFRTAAILFGGERKMKAGEYFLPRSEGPFTLAWRMVHGDQQIATVRITIPEGQTVEEISAVFNDRFPLFDNGMFEKLAPEGYLFPDTYFINESATASSTIKTMRDNFDRQIAGLAGEIEASGRTLEEIITMASILEGEVRDPEGMAIVSGILWKRLDTSFPLQVDATFVYFLGKGTRDLTLDDLKSDSPYNTYLYKGLPPTPISNPGLESIKAALRPTSSPYLYFLTADDGTMHYSKDFEEHKAKKKKYISTS